MTQETGHPFSEDWGESEIEANLNETDGWVKSLMLQREREREREKETDAHPFPRPRENSSVNSRPRKSTEGYGGARARSYSESSNETGPGYSSGQDDYQTADEENAPIHGRSIIASRHTKISLSEFQPIGFNNFETVCRLVSDGRQLEEKVYAHFRAQFKKIKATHQDLQTKFYKTELGICKDSLNTELTFLSKEVDLQNNEKAKITGVLHILETTSKDKIVANNNLKMVMEGFKSSANFEKEQADSRLLTDQIKAHMTITKHTPLVGQDMVGVLDDKPIKLGFQLSPLLLEKLKQFKPNYDACVFAQKRFNAACSKSDSTEKGYGNINTVPPQQVERTNSALNV